MSIIQPFAQQTLIKLYEGIPWGDDYKEIRLFTDALERESYLDSKTLNTWVQCSVVKTGSKIKLEGQINDYITANYMSFENYGAGQTGNEREFFAFVTSVNYVNINTIEIEYKIDWIQSFLYEFSVGECYVEREHVNSDIMGEHTLPENIDTGEMVIGNQTLWLEDKAVMIQVCSDTNVSVKEVGGVVDCSFSQGFNIENLGALADLLNTYKSTPENVVQLVMITDSMLNIGAPKNFSKEVEFTRIPFQFSFAGKTYTPVNKKLGCYPYMMFTVDNFNGQIEHYHYEDFGIPKNVYQFKIEGQPTPKPCMQCFPLSYKNLQASPENCVTYDNFPECPWLTDTFKAWISQYGLSTTANAGATLVTTGIALAGNIAAGNSVGFAKNLLGLATSGIQLYEDTQNRKLHSKQMHGTVANSGLDYARGYIGFRVTQYMVKPEVAERIDKRLTRYGYRIDRTKKPNLYGRQYFNYVKCNGAVVDGEIPYDTKNALENALNSGVTFWHTNNMDNIYTSNPITTG